MIKFTQKDFFVWYFEEKFSVFLSLKYAKLKILGVFFDHVIILTFFQKIFYTTSPGAGIGSIGSAGTVASLDSRGFQAVGGYMLAAVETYLSVIRRRLDEDKQKQIEELREGQIITEEVRIIRRQEINNLAWL